MKIFVITLERYNKDEIIRSKIGNLDFEIFYGVDCNKITDSEYDSYLKRKKSYHILSKWQLANTLSHVKLYEKIINEEHDEVMILEDDFVFTKYMESFKDYYDQLPDDFDVFFLGLNNIHIRYDSVLMPNYSKNLFKVSMGDNPMLSTLEGTHALIFKKEFIKKIYDYQKDMLWTDDGSLTEYQKEFGANYFVATPQLIKTERCINL